nr:unnamed protein product [Callosobruchus chinensis]
MNTMYKSPEPAERWSTFVFIVRKIEPNVPGGLLEHPRAKECVESYARKRRSKRHSTATLMRRKQKMIKRLQRRDTLDKMQEDSLFKDIAKFLVSNKLKHNGYTYVPVMFSHQGSDRLAGFSAHDLNGDFGLKLTDAPSTTSSSTSRSTTTMSPITASSTTALWTVPTMTDSSEFTFSLPHLGLEGEKVATEGVNIHAGGSMVPGILIYPVAKKLKRFPPEKTDLNNVVDDALSGLGNVLDQSTKASYEFLPTYTLPVLKRGVPPECAEDTEKLLQLLATAKDKDNPPRRMIPGILVYPLSKNKRFILGRTNIVDSSATEDPRPTFYAVDQNLFRERAQKILKKEVPPECLKDTDQLLNMLANAIDENLTATSTSMTDEGSSESIQSTTESEKATSELEEFTFSDHSTASEMVDLNSLGINMGEAGGTFAGGGVPLVGAAPPESGSLMGAGGGMGLLDSEAGLGAMGGATLGEFGAPSSPDVLLETTECIPESTTECSEDRFGTESPLNNFGGLSESAGIQPALMERGSKSVPLMNNQSASVSDMSETSSHQPTSSTEAMSSPTTSNAGSSSTTQETECITVTASSSSESVTTPCDTDSTTATNDVKEEHVTKDMTKERLKRLEKDLKLVNEVERILNGKEATHKIHKRDLGSIVDDSSNEENQIPAVETSITVKTDETEYPETFYDKPSKTVREINREMLRGLGKLLKWRNSQKAHNPSRLVCIQGVFKVGTFLFRSNCP